MRLSRSIRTGMSLLIGGIIGSAGIINDPADSVLPWLAASALPSPVTVPVLQPTTQIAIRDAHWVTFSPDGAFIAPSGDSVHLWDLASNRERAVFKAAAVNVAFSPDGRLLAYGTDDGSVHLWDINALHETVLSLPVMRNHPDLAARTSEMTPLGKANSLWPVVAFSPDGQWIAQPTLQEPKVTLIDLATGQAKFILQFAFKDKQATLFLPWLLFSPDSQRFAAYDPAFESVMVWDVSTDQSRIVIRSPSASPTTWLGIPAEAAFSPDSRLFAVRTDSTTLKLFDVHTGRIRAMFSDAEQLAFSPDGRLFAVSSGNTIRIWDVQTQQRVIELPGGGSVAFSPNRHWLAAVNDLILRLWSIPG